VECIYVLLFYCVVALLVGILIGEWRRVVVFWCFFWLFLFCFFCVLDCEWWYVNVTMFLWAVVVVVEFGWG